MTFSIVALLGTGLTFLVVAVAVRAWVASAELLYPVRRRASTCPADYGLSGEQISFKSSDGMTLRGWWLPLNGAKGTVVLNHGYAGDCSPDLVYAPVLNRAGYNVCLFDYRGHGDSDGNCTSMVYFERRDLVAALDWLCARGIDRVVLIGFSMGGAIALATAPSSPMVAGVISDCTFGELAAVLANAALKRGIPRWMARPSAWLVILFACIRLRANLFSADPIRWISKIAPRPVLIMHGAADEEIPVEQAHRLFQAAREPKELWIVPGAKHRQIEAVEPEEYERRMIDFIDRVFAKDAKATA